MNDDHMSHYNHVDCSEIVGPEPIDLLYRGFLTGQYLSLRDYFALRGKHLVSAVVVICHLGPALKRVQRENLA